MPYKTFSTRRKVVRLGDGTIGVIVIASAAGSMIAYDYFPRAWGHDARVCALGLAGCGIGWLLATVVRVLRR